MAITNFIPEVWSAALLSALRDRLVYAQGGMINRRYEGDISRAGDTVHITSVQDVTVRDYTRNAGLQPIAADGSNSGSAVAAIQYDILNDSQQTLTITEQDYFAFGVDDLDTRQALSGFVQEASQSAAYGLAQRTDTFVAGLMAAGAGNDLGDVNIDPASPNQAYDLLVQFRTALTRSNTPESGRWVVVPPEFYAVLLHDDRFIRQDASGTTSGLRNGMVGRAAGFEVIEANAVPSTGTGDATEYTVIAGHADATTFADQIAKTEALRLESGFSDAVRGLHVYGGKVLTGRENLLAVAAVTVSTPVEP